MAVLGDFCMQEAVANSFIRASDLRFALCKCWKPLQRGARFAHSTGTKRERVFCSRDVDFSSFLLPVQRVQKPNQIDCHLGVQIIGQIGRETNMSWSKAKEESPTPLCVHARTPPLVRPAPSRWLSYFYLSIPRILLWAIVLLKHFKQLWNSIAWEFTCLLSFV